MGVTSTATTNTCTTLEDVDVECTHCGVRMTSHLGSSKQIRYFHCPSCSRWMSSVYSTDVFRGDTKMRARKPMGFSPAAPPAETGSEESGGFRGVKDRLDSWLRSLDARNPFTTLGISPDVSDHALRERYLYLARRHHPDHGGSAEEMRRINEAYEKVLSERETRRTLLRVRALPAGS